MAADDGASEQSRLAAERIARLKRQLEHAERAGDPWGGRADGERRSADLLSQLTTQGWFLLHDVHWPGRPLANIDHVLVGPGGVVVVDVKSWSGKVEVRAGELRQNGYTRNPAVDGALGQAAAVAALLDPPHRHLVRSIICLAGQPDFAGVTGSGVEVLGINLVAERVAALPAVLDPPAVVGLYSQLGQQLTQSPAVENHGPVAPGKPVPPGTQAPNRMHDPSQHRAQKLPRNPEHNQAQHLRHPGNGPMYPPPLPSRYHGSAADRTGRLSAMHTPGTPRRQGRRLAVGLWSLLILGIMALALSAALWIQ
ncbi:NERD domain-containing protein [Arthrobacter sp. ISL-72]|uniref:NERD domain-containing protein n=1 Tax=Arthrobacter sp. ISL-72 TaxID=2819114 RepID=UPI001BEBB1E4|nr:NERD domain-containing protein [Arthrobacter sp. ISL-72]MBT2597040.1 NERD domain-containing protein [Arthrobacter sp. ISL-72]